MMMFLLPDPASWFCLCLSFVMIHQDVWMSLGSGLLVCWCVWTFSHNPLRTMNSLPVKLKSQWCVSSFWICILILLEWIVYDSSSTHELFGEDNFEADVSLRRHSVMSVKLRCHISSWWTNLVTMNHAIAVSEICSSTLHLTYSLLLKM